MKIRILKAAKKLTAEKGFEATTVREICAEAEANLSLVSYYYGGKEHVFEAVLDAFIPIYEASAILAQRKLGPVEGLCTLVREIVLFRSSDPEIARIIHQEITRETPRTPLVQKRIARGWKLLRGYLDEGARQGLFQFRSLDMTMVQVMGSILFGDNRSGIVTAMEEPFPDADTQVMDVLTYILRGVGYSGEAAFAGEPIIPTLIAGCDGGQIDREESVNGTGNPESPKPE
ncbi:TetR family transcriptional regulator [Saccharibacillus alkalitolerans]|uniref:TetR/AcrR family transcriptional regulator n=1 Tax=Saccharibacillus alkalitolerans TaxID=2705290 RepID=A0ABX0F8K9_9BACL|nr:TetR family transcriptional regulator [Saccharibacillus alkalitolerans]NGZ76648.1 TetR/AcrR family transcriptional regulator [Saccharibacillus alkalitolerans]